MDEMYFIDNILFLGVFITWTYGGGEGGWGGGGVEVDDTLTSHKIINTVFWGSVS